MKNKCGECQEPTDFFSKKFRKFLCKECYSELRWGVIPENLFKKTVAYNTKYKTGGRAVPEAEGDSGVSHNCRRILEDG